MADSRNVPANLLTWPRLENLLPDQKLIFSYLWFNRFAGDSGCYHAPVELMGAELSLKPSALAEALSEFKRRGLIEMDLSTGEIFVLDWFRFNKFPRGPRQSLLSASINKIESEVLKNMVIEKSKACVPKESKVNQKKKGPRLVDEIQDFDSSWRNHIETLSAELGIKSRPGESWHQFSARVQANT